MQTQNDYIKLYFVCVMNKQSFLKINKKGYIVMESKTGNKKLTRRSGSKNLLFASLNGLKEKRFQVAPDWNQKIIKSQGF